MVGARALYIETASNGGIMNLQSQLDPLPESLPFEIVSKTIGRGAYALYDILLSIKFSG